jgi:hypothetical protein
MLEAGAHSIDEAIAGHAAEESEWLQSKGGPSQRSSQRYRHAYQNQGGSGTNYWVDVVLELDGRVFTCQTGSIGPNASEAAAKMGGDLCETLATRESSGARR